MMTDRSMNGIFNALSIVSQYTLSLKWPASGLKCLVTSTPKGQPLKIRSKVWNIPISESGRNYYSLFKLNDSNWVIIMEQKRNIEYS